MMYWTLNIFCRCIKVGCEGDKELPNTILHLPYWNLLSLKKDKAIQL